MFEKWFASDPRFEKQHQRAARLVVALRNASGDRNLLAHSNVQEFIEGPPVRMIVSKMDIKKDDLIFSRAEWSEEQIFGLARSLNNLSHGLWTISQEVFNEAFLGTLRTTQSPDLSNT